MSNILVSDNISKAFGGVKAVQNVSFEVKKGEILGLIGPNGSGKSTVVNLITGVYRLDTGKIIFDGNAIPQTESVPKRANRGMGRTFQTPKPFSGLSVYENVYIVGLQEHSPDESERKTREVLDLLELTDSADMLSSKLPIEKRKWLDLARILVNEPKFIMMDEVMAGLNPSEMENSLVLIKRINEEYGVSILFIEHVMKAVVSLCHRCIVLNEGKLLVEGEPREVLNIEEVITAYLGSD